MRRDSSALADMIAYIALVGVTLSLAVWVGDALVNTVAFGGRDLLTQLYAPSLQSAFGRAVAIVAILIGTLAAQAFAARYFAADKALRIERNRTRQIYEYSPDRVICMDADGHLLYTNSEARRAFGDGDRTHEARYCFDQLYGRSEACAECPRATVIEAGGEVSSTVISHAMPDGAVKWFLRLIYPIQDDDGKIVSVVEIARDITELKEVQEELERSHKELETRIEERTSELQQANGRLTVEIAERERVSSALRDSEERYRGFVESSPDMILVHREQRVTFVNSAGLALLGASKLEEAVGLDVLSLWEPSSSDPSAEDLRNIIVQGELDHPVPLRLRGLDGGGVDVEVTVNHVVLDDADHVQCVVRDITQRVHAEQTIRKMAYYDSMTGLPNRTLFKDRLERVLRHAKREGSTVAVAFLDLDDFKAINDTLGHSVGDELLKAVGQRITELLRDTDTVARHSGDEFTILAMVHQEGDVDSFAERILDGLRPMFRVCGHDLHVTGSLGVAVYPTDGTTVDELLKNADAAMYHAKELGQSQYALYREEMRVAALDRLMLESELRRAVDAEEFLLYYQPQVDIRTSEIVGVEALLRWQHPVRGLIGPGEFLAVAEQAGLMGNMGRWVLNAACSQARLWLDDGLTFGRLSVNLGAQEFLRQDVVKLVATTLEQSRIPAHLLELEITEGVALQNINHVLRTLSQLRELGVRIAIDDFGTGYSSMSYLQRYPISTLKIDSTFMRRVDSSEHDAAIAAMLVNLCGQLDLDVIAEGIENDAQLEFLFKRGCITAQGNLFSPPLPAEEVAVLLAKGLTVRAR